MNLARWAVLRPSVWLITLAGVALLSIVVLMTAEGILRAFFGTSVQGATEINEVLLGLLLLSVLPLVVRDGPHIRVDFVYNLLPIRLRGAVDALGEAVVATFLLAIAWSAAPWALAAFDRDDVTQGVVQIPIYPVKLLLLAVTAVGGVQLSVALIRNAVRTRRAP